VRDKEGRLLEWSTTHEVDLVGFRIVWVDDQGRDRPLRDRPVPCAACDSGDGSTYRIELKSKEARSRITIAPLHASGVVGDPVTALQGGPAPAAGAKVDVSQRQGR